MAVKINEEKEGNDYSKIKIMITSHQEEGMG
jgi:hypothetical protein